MNSEDNSSPFLIREIQNEDKTWIEKFIEEQWASNILITRRKKYYAHMLEGFIAFQNGNPVGLITLYIENSDCQIITLDAIIENIGIGTELLKIAADFAQNNNCGRIWLITTNDNTPALRFYQTRGFRLKQLYCNEIEYARKLKPEMPLYGIDSIPIRDEIELEYKLL
jgi:N-acetylglutamate synthase-like GNAT family acetyltransferase